MSKHHTTRIRYLFQVHHTPPDTRNHWGRLVLTVHADVRDVYDGPRMSFHWQSNADSPADWYGFHVELSNATNVDRVNDLWRKVHKVLGDLRKDPQQVGNALATFAEESQWSEVDSRMVPLGQLPEPGAIEWGDVGTYDDRPQARNVGIIADTEEEARRLIFRALAREWPDKLEKWILAGKGVRACSTQGARLPLLADVLKPAPVAV